MRRLSAEKVADFFTRGHGGVKNKAGTRRCRHASSRGQWTSDAFTRDCGDAALCRTQQGTAKESEAGWLRN